MIGLNYLKYELKQREMGNAMCAPFTIAETLAEMFNEQKIENFLDVNWRSLNDELGRWYDDRFMGIHDLLEGIESIPLRIRLADFLAKNADDLFMEHACTYIKLESQKVYNLYSRYDTYALTENDYMSELSLLKQRHDALHHEYSELQAKENGHAAVIKGQENMIRELQEDIKNLEIDNALKQKEIFELKKELELKLKGTPTPTQPQATISNESPEAEEQKTSIAKFKYIKSDDKATIEIIEKELEQLMDGNNAAKVCDVLKEYQNKLDCPRKLPGYTFDALHERWPNLQFSRDSFIQAWKRKNK